MVPFSNEKNKSRSRTSEEYIKSNDDQSPFGFNQIFLINYSSTLKEYTMMLILKRAHIEKKIIKELHIDYFWFFDQAFVFKIYTTYKHDKTKK